MPKKSQNNIVNTYNDRSKVKTIFNYIFKEIYSIIDKRLGASAYSWSSRGLPDIEQAKTAIQQILLNIEKAFVTNKIPFYKSRLAALTNAIIRYAEEKHCREEIADFDIGLANSIIDLATFKKVCNDCLWAAHTL